MKHSDPLAHFRFGYCLWLCVALVLQWRTHLRWVRVRGRERELPRLLDWLPMPRLETPGFALVGLALVASLATAAAPAENMAWALLLASATALMYFAQLIELPDVRRKPNTVPVILLLLGLAGLATHGGESERIAWLCLLAVKILVAQIYFSSGLVKLRQAGWRWALAPNLRIILLRYHLRDDSKAALWLAHRPAACRAVAALVLVFELTFWLVIPFPALAWVYLPAGLIFHLGTAGLMRIHYWIYVVPAYFAFVVMR
ncbi:MAG TPA: hypothetical protein VNW30_08260 [Opitutaceae bacterium]|jgi:hypothetical protein|nr:hypothetical protein [Opitutaceae bacterium]